MKMLYLPRDKILQTKHLWKVNIYPVRDQTYFFSTTPVSRKGLLPHDFNRNGREKTYRVTAFLVRGFAVFLFRGIFPEGLDSQVTR